MRLALAPAAISLTVLPRMNDRSAAPTFLTGETFDKIRAAAMGLVTMAVPEAALDAEVDAEVDAVCANPVKGSRQGLRETKALLGWPSCPARSSRTGQPNGAATGYNGHESLDYQ